MRILYLGTPEFAVPTLRRLISEPDITVVGAVCQPDRPAGRGNKVAPPPVKAVAVEHDIPVLQPEKLSKAPEIMAQMKDLKPDLIVMVAFGQILKQPVLDLAPHGVVNLHGSLLPKLRGAAPINWAVINGDTISGVTTMVTELGVDTGPMLLKREVPLGPDMTSEELARELAQVGAPLVIETITQMREGKLKPEKQDDSMATYAPILTKEMGAIDWQKPAQSIHNLVRGLLPWPGTYTTVRGGTLKVLRTRLIGLNEQVALGRLAASSRSPGEIARAGEKIISYCGADGQEFIELLEVQPANKSRMNARDWFNGLRITGTEVLGLANA